MLEKACNHAAVAEVCNAMWSSSRADEGRRARTHGTQLSLGIAHRRIAADLLLSLQIVDDRRGDDLWTQRGSRVVEEGKVLTCGVSARTFATSIVMPAVCPSRFVNSGRAIGTPRIGMGPCRESRTPTSSWCASEPGIDEVVRDVVALKSAGGGSPGALPVSR